MQNARVESEFCNGMLCFRLTGEIDHHSVVSVREQMDKDIWFYSPSVVVLTLDGIDFMDSSGLGLILGRYTRVRDLQGEMRLENPTPQIEKILRLAGVDKLIPVIRRGKVDTDKKKEVKKQ